MKKTYKLLLADNHPMFLQGLKITLLNQKQFNFEISECENGADVISSIQKNDFDLILLDISMPEMNGLEVLKIIRKTLKKDIPVLMMTTHYNENFIYKSIEYGATGYLLKYVDSDELLIAISTALKNEQYYSEEIQKIISSTDKNFNEKFLKMDKA